MTGYQLDLSAGDLAPNLDLINDRLEETRQAMVALRAPPPELAAENDTMRRLAMERARNYTLPKNDRSPLVASAARMVDEPTDSFIELREDLTYAHPVAVMLVRDRITRYLGTHLNEVYQAFVDELAAVSKNPEPAAVDAAFQAETVLPSALGPLSAIAVGAARVAVEIHSERRKVRLAYRRGDVDDMLDLAHQLSDSTKQAKHHIKVVQEITDKILAISEKERALRAAAQSSADDLSGGQPQV